MKYIHKYENVWDDDIRLSVSGSPTPLTYSQPDKRMA
jgi:hypothetical protein